MTKKLSHRQIAKQLGITPAYLSYMVNGKRPWREDLYQRYCYLVNTSVNSTTQIVDNDYLESGDELGQANVVSYDLALAGARGSRTHRPDRRAGANGFEVRKAHRDPSTPVVQKEEPANGWPLFNNPVKLWPLPRGASAPPWALLL